MHKQGWRALHAGTHCSLPVSPAKGAGARCLRRVQLTVIDVEGKRNTLRGLVGQRLIDVLADNMDELGGDRVPRPAPFFSQALAAALTTAPCKPCLSRASPASYEEWLLTRRLRPLQASALLHIAKAMLPYCLASCPARLRVCLADSVLAGGRAGDSLQTALCD